MINEIMLVHRLAHELNAAGIVEVHTYFDGNAQRLKVNAYPISSVGDIKISACIGLTGAAAVQELGRVIDQMIALRKAAA